MASENRTSSVDVGANYTYDGDGQRVIKNLGGAGTVYWTGPDGAILAESDLGGNLTAEYVFFSGKRIARIDNPAPGSGTVRYYFSDHLGSTSMVTSDDFSQVLSDSDYYPYGREIPMGGAGDTNHYKFTGKERDGETGLDNFVARYYGVNVGRMMSADGGIDQHPENPQTWNLYSYVSNNPLNAIDPSGEFVCAKNVTDQQCENAHESVENAEKYLSVIKQKHGENSREYQDAKRAIDALGGRKDNGVTLQIGQTKGWGGNVEIGKSKAATQDNPNGQNVVVNLNADSFDGSSSAGVDIAHEGSHVADASDWIASGFNRGASVNEFQSEDRAYSAEIALSEAMGMPDFGTGPSGNTYMVWNFGWRTDQARFMVREYLLKNEYHLTPSSKITLWQDHTRGNH